MDKGEPLRLHRMSKEHHKSAFRVGIGSQQDEKSFYSSLLTKI